MEAKTRGKKKAKPLRGKELLRAAVNQIIKHPKTWNQKRWHCGTSHCVGGWCQLLAGLPMSDLVSEEITPLLGINRGDADYLFSPSRTLPEIYIFAKTFIECKPLPLL